MKWLRVLVIAAVTAILILTPVTALASENIDVVAVPNVGAGITSFTAVIIDDNQVDLSWTIGDNIINVMVRAQYSSMPMSRTEGYLVYEGDELSCSDTSMDFDETPGTIYYRIWAQNDAYVWLDSEVNTQELEAPVLLLIGFILLCLGLTISGYALHRGSLAFAGMAAWMAMGAYCYITADGEWSIYMGLFWVSIAMIITSGIEGALLNKGEEKAEDEVDYQDEMQRALDDMDVELETKRRLRRAGLE